MATERYYIKYEHSEAKQKRWEHIMQLSSGKAMNNITDFLMENTDATDLEIARLASKGGKMKNFNRSIKDSRFHSKKPLRCPTYHGFNYRIYNDLLAERDGNVNWLLKYCDQRLLGHVSSLFLENINSFTALRCIMNNKDYYWKSAYSYNGVGVNTFKDVLFYSTQIKGNPVFAKNVLSEQQLDNMTKVTTESGSELSLDLINHIISTYNGNSRIKSAIRRYTYSSSATEEFNKSEFNNAQEDMQRCVLKETYLQNGLPDVYKVSPYNRVSFTEAVYSYRPNVNYRLSLLGVLDCLIAMNISVSSYDINSMSNPSEMIYGVKQKLFSAIMSSYKMFKKADSSLRESTREVLVERLNNISNDFCRGNWKFCINKYAEYDDATFAKVEQEQKKSKTTRRIKTKSNVKNKGKVDTFSYKEFLENKEKEQ